MKCLVILLFLIFSIALLGEVSQVFAMCVVNEDWSNAPCFDQGTPNATDAKLAWAPYYDYKGESWMEQKKIELMIAIRDGSLNEWLNETVYSSTNTNVYSYFHAFDNLEKYKEVYAPVKQLHYGFGLENIKCKDGLVLIQRYDGSPACVKPVTKQHLIERGWAETKSLDEIYASPGLIKQNIVRIEDGYISLYPENMCASLTLDLPTEQDIQRYKNDENGLNDTNVLQITSDDLKEIPNIRELISAVHSIDFPYNKHSSAYLDIVTFVEYEFFLMDKAIKKYGDSKGDYFKQLDSDYEERLADPAKQGFTNHFIAPLIVYNENVYSIGGVHFWTSDEHKPKRMGVYPQDVMQEDEKFIMLTEEDMKSVPEIKDAIESIGTIKESISASKGLPEDQWNEYREWFKQKSQDQLNAEKFRLMQYDEEFYSVGFSIC